MMPTDKQFQLWRLNLTYVGAGIAALYWLIESLMHAFYWQSGSLLTTLLAGSQRDELEMRLVMVILMVGFGWLAERGKQHYLILVEKQKKLNRLLRFLSECNTGVQRQTDEQRVLDGVCRAAVEVGKFSFAWVGMQRPEGFTLVAWASADPSLNEHIILLEEHAALLTCLGCRGVMDQGSGHLCEMATRLDCPAPWKEAFISQGCKHAYALPITVSGQTVGVFEIYAGNGGLLTQEESAILDEAAGDVSVALTALDTEKMRQQQHEDMRKRIDELERFQKATVQREFRIKELRDEIELLNGRIKAHDE